MTDPMQRAASPTERGSRNHRLAGGRHEQSSSPSLFDTVTDTGADRRDRGHDIAVHAADVRVRVALDDTVRDLAARREPFTAETVRRRVSPIACGDGIMGAVIRRAQQAGTIEHVGFVRAERPEARGRWIMQWVGTEASR